MEFSLKEIIQLAVQGGFGVAMLIVWYITQSNNTKQTSEAISVASRAVDAANNTTKEAFSKNDRFVEALLQHIRDEQEERTLLTGVLDRLSIRLETPISCPMALAGAKFKIEVER